MSLLAVTSASPGEGKTTAAVLLAHRALAAGKRVLLLRAAGPDGAESAATDATVFASVPGAGAAPRPLAPGDVLQHADRAPPEEVTIVEVPQPDAPDVAAGGKARFVVAVAGIDAAALEAAQSTARGLAGPVAAIALQVPRDRLLEAPALLEGRGLTCLGALAEDRLLAAFRVSELVSAVAASYLYEDGDPDDVAEYIMIGSIGADPGEPYFGRHAHKAAIARFDKTDVQLAALASPPLACLLLTGGRQPSPYLLDRAQGQGIPIVLTEHETVAAVQALEQAYGTTRLGGAQKLERLRELSQGLDGEKLSALMG